MITISQVIKTIKENYDYRPVDFSLSFGEVNDPFQNPVAEIVSNYNDNQDIGMLLSFARYHKLGRQLTHALFCEKYADVLSTFDDNFYKQKFIKELEAVEGNPVFVPLYVQYLVKQCNNKDNTGVQPFILSTSVIKSACSPENRATKYQDCLECQNYKMTTIIPIREIIKPKFNQDTTTEILSMWSAVGIEWLPKVFAIGKELTK